MRKSFQLLFFLFIFVFTNTAFLYADSVKICIFDFKKIIDDSKEGKRIEEEVNKKGDELKEKLEKEMEEFQSLQKDYKRKEDLLNEKEKVARQSQIQKKAARIQMLRQEAFQKFREMENLAIEKIKDEIVKLAEEFGKKKSCSIIFEKNTAGISYALPQMDMTDELIKNYDKEKAKKSDKSKKN